MNEKWQAFPQAGVQNENKQTYAYCTVATTPIYRSFSATVGRTSAAVVMCRVRLFAFFQLFLEASFSGNGERGHGSTIHGALQQIARIATVVGTRVLGPARLTLLTVSAR